MTRALLPSRLPQLARAGKHRTQIFRNFRTTSRSNAAHEFSMPAMSPTMTEGNITSWKVKEGDSFAAGDVLLEIETDKAQMDVEAQDDGVMAKILQESGAKGVKVGTRIAITADAGDDISSIDMPVLPSNQSPKQSDTPSNVQEDATSTPRSKPASSDVSDKHQPGLGRNTKYPLFPSVIQLLHQEGLQESDTDRITATGPNGRLLKGDVLAHLGAIKAGYPSQESKRLEDLSHLDLNNIELREIEPQQRSQETVLQEAAGTQTEAPSNISEIALPVSLSAVNQVRKRIRDTLGVDMSVETFIARATHLCNDALPRSKSVSPSADELFDAVLGLDNATGTGRGPILVPQIRALQLPAFATTRRTSAKPDIIDQLSASPAASKRQRSEVARSSSRDTSLFSISVPTGDELRGKVFLERMKTVLQVEPGRLVL